MLNTQETQESTPDVEHAPSVPNDTSQADKAEENSTDQQVQGDGYPFTDTGNARRLLHWFGKDLKYCPDWASWLVWDGTYWRKDEQGQIVEFAKRVSQKIRDAANKIKGEDEDKQREARRPWYKWAHTSESARVINAMITLAESDPRVVVRSSEFDKDPCVFNCVAGSVDLRTGILAAHRREDLLTKISPVTLDSTTPTKWLEFLNLIMANNQGLIAYIQRCIGYSLSGRTDEKSIFISHGGGNNGKTIFHRIILALFGPSYGMAIAPETIMEKRFVRKICG